MVNLSDAIGAEMFERVKADPVLFVQAFDREPWNYQVEILGQALERGENGKFKRPTVIVSMPRQNGKSTLSGWAALWRFYTDENQEIISVANDRDQARIILNDARRIIRNSEVLHSLIDGRFGLTRSEIRLANENRWLIKSSDAVFSRGLRPSVICYDELGWAVDRELFDVLSAGQAAQQNPLILVTSTVGPIQAGILWELFELARSKDPNTLLIYETENKSPLITQDYLDRERALLPAHIYAREHQNLWGEGSDAYCTEEDWKRAIEEGSPLRDSDLGPSYCFVDLGWAHDETAIITAKKREDGKIPVLSLDTFRGTQRHNVDFSSVESRLEELAARLHVRKIEIESPQGVSMAQRLSVKGVYAKVMYPTAKSNQEHWGALYTALKNGTIILPNDAKLRRQLLTLTIKSTQTGWKVVDVPSIHQDRARAVAGAVAMIQSGGYSPLPEKQPAQKSKWVDKESLFVEGVSRWKKY